MADLIHGGGALLIRGKAGIGKSTLLRQRTAGAAARGIGGRGGFQAGAPLGPVAEPERAEGVTAVDGRW
jgi:hypothetical protein